MTYAPQNKENSNSPQHQQQSTKATAPAFSDERESTRLTSLLQAMMANSPQQQKLKATAQMMANSPVQQRLNTTAQSFANKPEPLQRMEDEEPLQGKLETEPAQLEAAAETPRPNNTGLPDNLKSGIENLSGMSMNHVKVHYNSDKPAQLQAHAYAQGSDIHVAPGQEQHLPHEAWHVVQQAQGRVKPRVQMKAGVEVNDDAELEAEADLMGGRAVDNPLRDASVIGQLHRVHPQARGNSVQRKIIHPTTWFPADKPAVMDYNAVAGLNSVTLDILTKTSKPEEVEEMDDLEIRKTIMDPSRGNKQRLTKMHLIRGRFGAPGELENLMLGTAASNNFDDDSHYAQVEKPIADFLNGDKGKRMVDYKVTPYGDVPAYFDARLKVHPTAASFVGRMCPQIFACAVQFATTNDNVNWFWAPQQIEHVRLDNKYENGGNEVP